MRNGRFTKIAAFVGLLAAAGLSSAWAADRALLIGVGNYADPGVNPLPGIDLDVDMMETVTRLLGFAPDHVRVLEDAAASRAAVVDSFRTWLVDDVAESDRVLVYFSGHGTRVRDSAGDEQDGFDEALVLHDTRDTPQGMSNLLVDDEINELLASIPSSRVVVVFDACHSGTSTRSLSLDPQRAGTDGGVVKYFRPRGLSRVEGDEVGLGEGAAKVDSTNYAALTSAADNEQSIATTRGSLFTIGLHQALTVAAREGQDVTLRDLAQLISGFLAEVVQDGRLFHPQVDGSPALADASLGLVTLSSAEGPNRDRMDEQTTHTQTLSVQTVGGSSVYAPGQRLELEVEVPVAGYLSVVAVDEGDVMTVLMPNQYVPERRVEPGTYRVPDQTWPDDVILAATDPGSTAVYLLVSPEPLGLFESADGERDAKGRVTSLFGTLSPVGTKAIERNPVQSGKIDLQVRDQGGRQ